MMSHGVVAPDLHPRQWRAGCGFGFVAAMVAVASLPTTGWSTRFVTLSEATGVTASGAWILRTALLLLASLGIGAVLAQVEARDLRGWRGAVGVAVGLLAPSALLFAGSVVWCFAARWCRVPFNPDDLLFLMIVLAHAFLPILALVGVFAGRRLFGGETTWKKVRMHLRLGFLAVLVSFIVIVLGQYAWAGDGRVFLGTLVGVLATGFFVSPVLGACRLPRRGKEYGASEWAAHAVAGGMMGLLTAVFLGIE